MKKAISIILLLSLFVPITGTYMWFKYEKKLIKREIKHKIINGINDNELVFLKFAKSDTKSKLLWKHSKEFEWNGEMYDVIGTKNVGDSIVYKCWWDNDETKLNKKLACLVSDALGNNTKHKENNTKLLNFFKSLYCHTIQDQSISFSFCKGPIYYYYSDQIISLGYEPNVPPPQASNS